MHDRRRLIELIQSLSKQEGAQQPTAEQWLRDQDEKKARGNAQASPADPDAGPDDPTSTGDTPSS
jgi:hypothetical protein